MKTQLSAEFVMALIILFSICYCQHSHFGWVVENPFSIPIISDVSVRFCIFSRSTTSKATGTFCFFRFNCNEEKLLSIVKQSQNILIMIVAKMFWKNFTIYRFLAGSNVASASSSRHEEQKDYPLLNGEPHHLFFQHGKSQVFCNIGAITLTIVFFNCFQTSIQYLYESK